jgi:hypothetical protein
MLSIGKVTHMPLDHVEETDGGGARGDGGPR